MMNNTRMSHFIAPGAIQKSAGTWTPTVSTDLVGDVRTAADAINTLIIPIPVPSNSAYRAGAKLKSVDVFYKLGTAAADDFATVALKKKTLPAAGTAVSGADVAVTLDAGHDTAAERKATGDHTMTVTLNTPAYVDDNDAYELVLVIDFAATTTCTLFGARANYELRI